MNRFRTKWNSIYGQLGMLLVFATVLSAVLFLGVNIAGERLIDYFVESTDYLKREDSRKISSLQRYVTEQGLSTNDSSELTVWVKKQAVVAVQIYKNGLLVYDSAYPEEDISQGAEEQEYYWQQSYTVAFMDGNAEVRLYGFYTWQFYNYALIAELILAFFIFLIIVMLGIRKTINYIRTLSDEVKILEGGGLDYPITIKGNDELSMLAQGLDSMRESFLKQTELEKQIALANQRMVTEMSHDLRTPLTSIMLYTEILMSGKYKDSGQGKEYIRKIDSKARRLKQLSDHLFEYALIGSDAEVKLEQPMLFQTVFYDLLSETMSYLEERHFQVVTEFTWETCYIRVNQDYISRIFDNLTSNIVKYASNTNPVYFRSVYKNESAGIEIRNQKVFGERKVESTKIGVRNIKNMMQKMGGRTQIAETEDTYIIHILFPTDLGVA